MVKFRVADRSQGRPNAALYALAGAVIGASASLLGAYVTTEQQSKLDSLATKREAFAAFVAEAEQYGNQLSNVMDALNDGDKARFEEERTILEDEASGELYAAFSVVWMVGDANTAVAARDVRARLVDWEVEDETDRDPLAEGCTTRSGQVV